MVDEAGGQAFVGRPGRHPVVPGRCKGKEMVAVARQVPFSFHVEGKTDPDAPAFQDPAFMDNRTAPVHRWVPWIAGFSGAFVDSALSTYLNHLKGPALVLDPFAGVGTTMIQAAVRGHHVVGFEINPYAALASNVKLKALRIDTSELNRQIAAMESEARSWQNGSADASFRPPNFRSRIPFFSPQVETQVYHALAFLSRIADAPVRDLCRVAFGSVMVSFSNYTYEPSLSTRPGAGKPLVKTANVAAVLLDKLRQMHADIEWLRAKARKGGLGDGVVHNEDFFERAEHVEEASVQLMVTSPPYLNNYHYARNTRPQLYWLGLIASAGEQKRLEEKNFGTFWQIARTKQHVPLHFAHRGLERILVRLREKNPEKGEYGGQGWANYAASYFNDCRRFLAGTSRCLKKGGTGVIVVGNSILQGVDIRVEKILGDMAPECGLKPDGIHCLRDKRVGDSITGSSVRGQSSRATLSEWAVVVRKV